MKELNITKNYLDIQKGEYYNNTYSKIENLKKDFYVNHGFIHVGNVLKYSKDLAELFNLSNTEKELLYIAVCLHDIGYLIGRENHAQNGSIMARAYLKENNFDENSIDIICDAIARHSGKYLEDYNSPISLCLILADKLDFTRDRYGKESNSPYLAVVKNEVEIKDNIFYLNIYTLPNFDKNLLADDYFFIKLNKKLDLVSQRINMPAQINFLPTLSNSMERK